jgi:hypothetical protein
MSRESVQSSKSLNNVTPADAYFGRAAAIIKQRERIKREAIYYRRLQHRKLAALYPTPDGANTPLICAPPCAKCSDDGQRLHSVYVRISVQSAFPIAGIRSTNELRFMLVTGTVDIRDIELIALASSISKVPQPPLHVRQSERN